VKYTLINCYSDNNKGDLGIILATIDMIRENDTSCDIAAVSTYNFSDPDFASEHVILKQHVPVLPSVFGELNIGKCKASSAKLGRFAFDSVRMLLVLMFPVKLKILWRLIFSKPERETIAELENSDYIISKGGSFLCNDPDFRSRIALFRFLYIFLLCFRLGKKVVILCQSLGPVHGFFSRKALNYTLSKCHRIVLRENICLEQYPYLQVDNSKLDVINDIAFFLNVKEAKLTELSIDESKFNIGMTIKHVEKNKAAPYRLMMIDAIRHCIDAHGAHIYIFPHVTIENDIDNSLRVYNGLDDNYKSRVIILSENFSPVDLKALYSKMDIFIGTRLHSTIFSMGELVPSVCISYHGTKSLGVFSNYGLDEYVVTEYSSDLLIRKIDLLIMRRKEIECLLRKMQAVYKEKFADLFADLFPVRS